MTQGRRRLILLGLAALLLNLLRVAAAVPPIGQLNLNLASAAPSVAIGIAGTIVITVLKADLGEAPGLVVSAIGPDATSAMTDERGTVRLSVNAMGQYAISASAPGYLPADPKSVIVSHEAATVSGIIILVPQAQSATPGPCTAVNPAPGSYPADPDEQIIDIPPDPPGDSFRPLRAAL